MAGAETALEIGWLAEEVTKGTAVTTPTKAAQAGGFLLPERTKTTGRRAGTLSALKRKKTVHTGASWDTDSQPLDANMFPFWARKFLNGNNSGSGGVTIATPGGATNARLWTYPRLLTIDNLKAMTIISGDPNFQLWQSAYGMVDEAKFSGDASSDDAVMEQYSGHARFPTLVSVPTAPTLVDYPMLVPVLTDMWIDAGVGATIGTTKVNGQYLSHDLTVPTGVTYKELGNGADGGLDFAATGREATSPELSLSIHLSDMVLYNAWAAGDYLKIRLRFNAEPNSIETGFNHYVEVDIFGELDADFDWSDVADSNRVIDIKLTGQEDTTAGTDLIMRAQNARTTV
jgi:hypothetical protein